LLGFFFRLGGNSNGVWGEDLGFMGHF
jgi:hypothetical protein